MKVFKKHLILYVVFLIDTVSAITNGFDWSYLLVAVLTIAVFIISLVEVILDARN